MSPPSTRTLLTSLISQLSALPLPDPPPAGNILAALPPEPQQLLLTLHCLLPSTLLPALDLLDRGLVTRCTREGGGEKKAVFYVRSATTTPRAAASPLYEVRTRAWNCTCASFAFAACHVPLPHHPHHQSNPEAGEEGGGGGEGGEEKLWGGLCRGDTEQPVCKHLVACVLAEHCRLFAGFVREEMVDVNRMAELAVVWD